MAKTRIAVVGAGWWATQVHIPELVAHADAELVALCDRDPARLTAAAEASGAAPALHTDLESLLREERPDAVVIATTHASHYPLAKRALDAGVHTLVEKPLTLTAAHARDLVETARSRGAALLTGYPYCQTDLSRRARQIVSGGALGAPQFVHCVFNSYHRALLAGDDSGGAGYYRVHGPGSVYSQKEHSGGGHGHLQLTHSVGLLCFVTGLRIRSVQARMASHGLPVDLVDTILVEFDGGALGMVGGTSNGHLRRLDLSIGCAEGTLDLDYVAGSGALRTGSGATENLPHAAKVYPADAPLHNLIAVARGQAAVQVDGEVGWRAVELLDAAYRSAEDHGRAVTVDELYEREKHP